LLTLGSTVAVAKPTTNAQAPDETPSAEQADSSSGTSTEATAADSASPAISAPVSTGTETAEPSSDDGLWRQFSRWLQARPLAEPPAPPPPDVDPIPATGVTPGGAPATPAAFVQHLGPESFPGRSRGLYGGSMWLEPSFNGLQWPYMAHTGIGVSGNVWVDSGYEALKRNPTFPNSTMYFQQGRGVLRVTPTYVSGRFFVQGQAELVGNLCQATNSGGPGSTANTVCLSAGTFSTDDLWIRVGHWNIWDLKVGRFEGWEVYHLGMGMDQYTFERMGAGMFGVSDTGTNPAQTNPQLEVPSYYGVNYLHDRPTDGLAVGNVALHLYPTEYLRFELLAKLGTDNFRNDDRATGNPAATYLGGRPTMIVDVGWLKLKVGAEYQTRTPITQDPAGAGAYKEPVEQTIQKGVGGSLQFVIDPVIEFGVNAAVGRQEYTNSSGNTPAMPGYPGILTNSYTTKSVGGFANLRLSDLLMAGVGLNWTQQSDDYFASLNNTPPVSTGTTDYTTHLQGFAAVQYLLGGQLFIKAAFGLAKAYYQPSDPNAATWNSYMYTSKIGPVPIPSIRVRLMYLY
jgi:hypothetical protein